MATRNSNLASDVFNIYNPYNPCNNYLSATITPLQQLPFCNNYNNCYNYSMSPRHHSQLYRQLRDVGPRDAQRIIRMYEELETEIGRLEVVENFELTVYYIDALFSTGAYRQHLMMVDLAIQASIQLNIKDVPDVEGDVFKHLLFRKGVSAYRLEDYDTAIHVVKELIRIDPDQEYYPRFLRTILFKQQHSTLQFGRGSFIFCILLSAAIVTLELLFIRPFYPDIVSLTQITILAVFLLGVIFLSGAYLSAHTRAHRKSYRFLREQQNK
jgi:tetratricopeptide (TPR) repeat protein